MSLIITAIADDAVVQVWDRRLTHPNGDMFTDHACKAICISCADARVAAAFTGLAYVGPTPIDHWLVDSLTTDRAAEKPFRQLVHSLSGHATGLTVMLAGFGSSGPVAAMVSGQEDGAGMSLPTASDRCQPRFWMWDSRPMRKLDLIVSGAEAAVGRDLVRGIERVPSRFLRRAPNERVAFLVGLLRRAAQKPRHGMPISEECMGVVVTRESGFRATYHGVREPTVSYMPHLICRGTAPLDILISTDSGQQPRWPPPTKGTERRSRHVE